ncbi:Nuclear envelope morphology protein 1 [Rhodotorula kratochvilovae]
MNTLSFFLTTLRPAPPPSPRASTSELPISAALSPSPAEPDAADLPISAQMEAEEVYEAVQREEDGAAADERGEPFPGEELPPPRVGVIPPSRGSSRKGKARATGATGAVEGVAAREDPLRDGETVKTELERSEGVEPAFVQCTPSHPPPSYNGTLALRDPEKGVAVTLPSSASSTALVGKSPAWPWMTRLARWWPFRLTASLYVLVRRFLALFGLPYSPRPSYNALLAPAHAALSTEEGDALHLDEKGLPAKQHARLVSLALTLSQRSLQPTSRTRSTLSPSPSPSPTPMSIPRAPMPPPKLTPKTLVLDLDETLIHSTSRSAGGLGKRGAPKGLKTRVVEVVLDGRSTVYTVYKRPWVDFFLRKVSSWYTVVIFTASLPEYADPVIDWLDGGDGRGGMIGPRLFRADCMARNGSYVKDLSVVDTDLSRVCLVDNSPASYAVNQANGIPIEGWINDPHDECLLDLLPMLDSLRFTNDVRRVLGLRGFGRREAGMPLAEAPRRTREKASR